MVNGPSVSEMAEVGRPVGRCPTRIPCYVWATVSSMSFSAAAHRARFRPGYWTALRSCSRGTAAIPLASVVRKVVWRGAVFMLTPFVVRICWRAVSLEALGDGNLVMLRVGAAQIEPGWSGALRHGAPEEVRLATGIDGSPLKSGSKAKGELAGGVLRRLSKGGLSPTTGRRLIPAAQTTYYYGNSVFRSTQFSGESAMRWLAILLGLAAVVLGPTGSLPSQAQQAPPPTEMVAPEGPFGVAARRPIMQAACPECVWGPFAVVTKEILADYGYDVQICWNCNRHESPRYVADARIPHDLTPSEIAVNNNTRPQGASGLRSDQRAAGVTRVSRNPRLRWGGAATAGLIAHFEDPSFWPSRCGPTAALPIWPISPRGGSQSDSRAGGGPNPRADT